MLREDYIRCAAKAHLSGARFLRDTAAAVLCGYTLDSCRAALACSKLLSGCETLMDCAIRLSPGLMQESAVTKYTAVAEARMRLLGVETSPVLTKLQNAAERVKDVPPGTRGDVYDGFAELSKKAHELAAECASVTDRLAGEIREGRTVSAVPCSALAFLKRLCSDYAAVSEKLSTGECAELFKRGEEAEKFRAALVCAVHAQGVEPADTSAAALASLATSGLVPNVPAVLFDILLRYESLPAVGEMTECPHYD